MQIYCLNLSYIIMGGSGQGTLEPITPGFITGIGNVE